MRWRTGRRSENIEDRRGSRAVRRTVGIGGVGTILLVVVMLLLGVDPMALLQQTATQTQVPTQTSQRLDSAADRELVDFISVVLADTEDTWNAIFRETGETYREPTLVLFSGAVQSACGLAQAAMGPFYCAADQKLYIDLSFYKDLRDRYGAPGDFAQAYVIAHEVGHHVQTLLGISQQVTELRARSSTRQANALSVMQELQADCLAGIWAHNAHRTRHILESGDIEEGLNAAAAIGDDRMQRRAGGYVTPDSFTHGSSAQRVRWFKRGLVSGSLDSCDTFGSDEL